jgi:hypothetical protein
VEVGCRAPASITMLEEQGMMGRILVVEPGQQPALNNDDGEDDDRHNH